MMNKQDIIAVAWWITLALAPTNVVAQDRLKPNSIQSTIESINNKLVAQKDIIWPVSKCEPLDITSETESRDNIDVLAEVLLSNWDFVAKVQTIMNWEDKPSWVDIRYLKDASLNWKPEWIILESIRVTNNSFARSLIHWEQWWFASIEKWSPEYDNSKELYDRVIKWFDGYDFNDCVPAHIRRIK